MLKSIIFNNGIHGKQIFVVFFLEGSLRRSFEGDGVVKPLLGKLY